jgi:hypothetical protein
VKRWISCVLEFKGRHRKVMSPGQYTELFFLDEATALAAGHRPCAECQRARYELFRSHWAPSAKRPPAADDMDADLHAERLDPQRSKRTYVERGRRLPTGAMVADDDGSAWLVHEGRLRRWTPAGYTESRPIRGDARLRVLTPRSIVRVIAHGYPVDLHPTARRA